MILRSGSVPAQRIQGSGPRFEERFGDVAGLNILGVNIVTLAPGEQSAQRHWHSGSDEFIMVLSGQAMVIEDDQTTEIGPGDLALWPAGSEIGHHIINRSDQPLRYLCAGTNPDAETVRYPDQGETLHWIRPNRHVLGDDGTVRKRGQE